MLISHQARRGRFLHVVLGMVVGAAVMAVVAGLIAAVNLELIRAEHKRQADELRRQVEQLRLEVELTEERREAERIREEIELRNRRIRDLERAANAGSCLAGRVKLVAGELAAIDVGSGMGLGTEHSVRVYRTPLMQEYLGTLQLLQVDPDQSQGLFVPAHAGDQLRVGDIVVAAKRRP
jgi:hypothetical protein